jgi:hypothetical protein
MKTKIAQFILFSATLTAAVSAQTKPTLSPEQVTKLAAIKADTERRALPYAMQMASATKQIFENMLADKENQHLRGKLHKDLHRAAGHLLDIKGDSFRAGIAVLTADQKRLVREAIQQPGSASDLSEVIEKLFTVPGK